MLTKEALVKHVGEVAPEVMQKIAAVLVQIEQENPGDESWAARELDEIAQHTINKVAEIGALGRWGIAVGTGVAAGIANDLAGDLYSSVKRGLSKSRNLKAIIAANPDLKTFDKTRLQQSFDAIHRYAPEMTADPLVGGALLKSVADVSGNEGVAIKNIIDMRKNVVTPFRPGEVMKFDSPKPEKVKSPEEMGRESRLRGVNDLLKSHLNEIENSKDSTKMKLRRERAVYKTFDKKIDDIVTSNKLAPKK